MIKYSLTCKDCKNIFNSWFSASCEFDRLKKKNLITCVECNSHKIEKTIMSPNVANLENKIKKSENFNKKNQLNYSFDNNDLKKQILKYQKLIKDNCIDVGENFAYEARKIYYNEKKSKGIYGSATSEEINELEEEGINALTIPWIKKVEH
tara:strand:+ start:88 stop:540 length:453 start_codon:yes stop_codon:yes gene_type:complete